MGPRGCIPIGLVRTSPRIHKMRADEKVEVQEVNSLLGFTIIEIYPLKAKRSHIVRNWGLHGLSTRTSSVITAIELMRRSDGHLVSFDIPRVALQKTKWVIDQGLGGLMWWAVDEDWVDSPASAPAPASAKRDMKKKTKRACKAKGEGEGEIGYVHAVDPANSTSLAGSLDSTSATASISISGSASAEASSPSLSSESASPSDNVSSASETASSASSTSASDSATSTESSAQSSSQPSTSEAEGSKDGIQLNMGRSLVQVAKEGFERYASGLDGTQNVLGYPSSGMSFLAVDRVS